MRLGWHLGEQHDEARKLSPFILSYEALPGEKKKELLAEALDMLGFIAREGYSIQEGKSRAEHIAELSGIEKGLECADAPSVDTITALWRNRDPGLWEEHPNLFFRAGKKMLAAGEPLLAYDILSEGVDSMGGMDGLENPEDKDRGLLISMLQQKALALAQSGACEEANSILRTLHERGLSDSETLGILGRTWKDMALESDDPERKRHCLRESFACYNKTYEAEISVHNNEAAYYTGINAASVSLLAGDAEKSRQIAGEVRSLCADILEANESRGKPVSFWLYASLGEAALLQGDIEKAQEWYSTAARECLNDIRALGAMRKQARIILEASVRDAKLLDHCFPVPSVVLFSGHLLDLPSREVKRFPPENEQLVRGRIARWLEEYNGRIGYSSAACGSDIIFLEEMLRRGAEINIVLPFEKEPFIATSVDLIPGSDWKQRFEKVLAKANEIKILSQYNEITLDDDLLFANLYLYGTAQVRAERAGTDLKTLLVWDCNTAQSIAGTAALADLIRKKGTGFDVVAPLESGSQCACSAVSAPVILESFGNCTEVAVGKQTACHHSFLPLLIADVKGYSRLNKREKLVFAANFMGEMAGVLKEYEDGIMGRKTQGDSLFLVFRDLRACVQSARSLQERIAAVDWAGFGLSGQLAMRISLDAGPCYSYDDPITGNIDFCGDYVVRAARLEPVTPPGNIYASETFVAIAKALGIKGIKFNYAGQVELPKGYGRMQAFHVK